MEQSKAAAAIKKRFGNSTIAQQAALAATKALAPAASSGVKDQTSKPRVDLLYKNAAPQGPQHSDSGKSTPNTPHQAACGALAAIAKPSMRPYLTQRPELLLDNNRGYRMPEEDNLDEQLFRGRVDASTTPHGHSEAPCTDVVHGGDSRFGSRSPVNVHAAQMSESQPGRSCHQIMLPKQRSPSLSQRREEVHRLREKGASHALPAHRPNSPLPEDRLAMQTLVQSMASTSIQHDVQGQEGTTSTVPAGHAAQPSASKAQDGSEPFVGRLNTDACAEILATCDVQKASNSGTCIVPDAPQLMGERDCQSMSPVPIAISPDARPLSPLGKVIKSVPSELRHSAPPDMGKVQARYMKPADATAASREGSPHRQVAHQRHYWWRLGQMHADVPDYKSSQARMYENDHCLGTGHEQAVITLKQVEWSFDGAHPALAGEHCLRTREQNDALQKERQNAQKRIEEARRSADDLQRRSPARRGQRKAAAAVRASADSALLGQQQGSGSGSQRLNRQPRPNSADPALGSVPHDAVEGSSSRSLAGQDEVLRRLQEQSEAVAQRAVTVLSRSEQLGQTVDAPVGERTTLEHLRPQTAPALDVDTYTCFVRSNADRQEPMIPQSSASGAINAPGSISNEAPDGARRQIECSASDNGQCGQEVVAEQVYPHAYTDETVATGAYTTERYAAYSEDLNLDMQLRFTAGVQAQDVEGGYESDLERDTVQQHHMAAEHAVEMLRQSLEQEAAAEGAMESFKRDNAWMDEYRKDVVSRCRSEGMPEVGYFDEVVDAGFQSPEPIMADYLEDLSAGERVLLQQRLIPEDVGLVANEAIAQAERVTARARARVREGYFSDDAMNGQKRFRPVRSKTFGFEKRAQMRPKPISQVKMEQELEMKRRREEKETGKKFKAKGVPHTSSKKADGLFYKKQLEQSIAAKQRIEARKQELSEMMSDGAAFSFYVKDMERRDEKARRLEAHRNNKNRFQVPFKAKEVPAHVRENRVQTMLEKQRQRKEEARGQAHKKLSDVNKEFERKQGRVAKAMTAATQPFVGTVEDNIMYAKAPNSKSVHPLVVVAAKAVGLHDAVMQLPKKYKTLLQEAGHNLGYHVLNTAEMHLLGLARKNFEVRAKHSALRHTDTLWNKFSGKKPAGAVPDFDLLHAQWETRLTSARDRLRQRSLTRPKDFSFINGNPKEMAERQAREAERQQKVVLDQMLDEEELTELRWPFRSSRGKVNPTEPPVFMPVAYHETKASQLRRKYVQNRKEHGQYDFRSVKEERARAAAKQELQRRAKAHVASEQAYARQRIMRDMLKENNDANLDNQEGGVELIEGGEEIGEAIVSKQVPEHDEEMIDRLAEAHRQSRHNKIETDVSNMTRELLATAGLDVLRFVEGPRHPTQSAKQVLEAIVASVPRNRAEVGKQLSEHDDQVLKQCLKEIGQEWDTAGGNARENAIDRLKTHIWNFMR